MAPPREDANVQTAGNWRETISSSFEMFSEAGVQTFELDRNKVNKNIVTKALTLGQKQH